MASPGRIAKVHIRPLRENELDAADRIVRVAFGTFLGLPDPTRFMGDSAYVRTRWKADPSAVVAAEHEGKLIGTNFATNWRSFGFFGPLTVEPDYWERGVAQQLLAPTMEIFRAWGNRHTGLFTFANSPKHMRLYQKFGFWPRDLVAIMAKPVAPASGSAESTASKMAAAMANGTPELFSQATPESWPQLLLACREVTSANFEGLDVEREIRSVAEQQLGDTLLVWEDAELRGLAVCHSGPGTEAGTGVCYVKFGAVTPGSRAAADFSRLLDAVEAYARAAKAQKISAGVNLARREAFSALYSRGFRTELQGVAMESGDASSGYNRPGIYILDDWR
ncbi:MAG TPA: GNAT family N-acetyltransferase [Candidatus Acidoferrales bacterium]|jgi:GNAT superfamily N-acetyltransferase|nr:GNAT family N-acetyltransferase [Candidatus Acidoferrales bacterium]